MAKKAKPKKADPAKIRCVVAATNASGQSDFFGVHVAMNKSAIDNGDHYDKAKELAVDAGYEGTMVAFDENDGPAWLFDQVFTPPGQPTGQLGILEIGPKGATLTPIEPKPAKDEYLEGIMNLTPYKAPTRPKRVPIPDWRERDQAPPIRFDAIRAAMKEAMLDARDSDKPHRVVANMLRDVAFEFGTMARGLLKGSFGGDGNVVTFGSVHDALHEIANEVEENASVACKD